MIDFSDHRGNFGAQKLQRLSAGLQLIVRNYSYFQLLNSNASSLLLAVMGIIGRSKD